MKKLNLFIGLLFLLVLLAFSIKNISENNINIQQVNYQYTSVETAEVHNFPAIEKKAEIKPIAVKKLTRISAYTLSVTETDTDPNVASCGHVSKIKGQRMFAVSQDLFFKKGKKWLCGKKASIQYSDGTIVHGIIWDTMNRRYKNTADVTMQTKENAVQHGVKKGKIIIY